MQGHHDVDRDAEIYNKGFMAGAEHRSQSPETKAELSELKGEWSEHKKLLRNYAVGAIVLAASYGIWVGTIQNSIGHLIEEHTRFSSEYSSLNTRVQSNDIATAEVRTRLANIEATLLEIRRALNIK